eukprot:TRINITY_DN57295_c0_g1_i1.p1 TRINITY_DN57295_c0_g1~~TRINITY_DN57295_c0_g1_i1.p1  ORF type:complete len:326 (-),score=72.06 TRINITY_DN57295_c0_g1_i1:79-1056(-)
MADPAEGVTDERLAMLLRKRLARSEGIKEEHGREQAAGSGSLFYGYGSAVADDEGKLRHQIQDGGSGGAPGASCSQMPFDSLIVSLPQERQDEVMHRLQLIGQDRAKAVSLATQLQRDLAKVQAELDAAQAELKAFEPRASVSPRIVGRYFWCVLLVPVILLSVMVLVEPSSRQRACATAASAPQVRFLVDTLAGSVATLRDAVCGDAAVVVPTPEPPSSCVCALGLEPGAVGGAARIATRGPSSGTGSVGGSLFGGSGVPVPAEASVGANGKVRATEIGTGCDPETVKQLVTEHEAMRGQLERLWFDIEDAMHNGRNTVCWPIQ